MHYFSVAFPWERKEPDKFYSYALCCYVGPGIQALASVTGPVLRVT